MKRTYLRIAVATSLVTVGAVCYFVGRAAAGVPQQPPVLSYSGVLLDALTGQPTSGTVSVEVALWDAATAGNQLCDTAAQPIALTAGRFRVGLDPSCVTAVHQNTEVWVEVTANGTPLPRSKLGAVPYALEAGNATPSGAVMFFNLPACPAGWSELVTARGRYIVGLPDGGTLAGTDGKALSDLEDRAAGQHSHTVIDPGHSHGFPAGPTGQCCGPVADTTTNSGMPKLGTAVSQTGITVSAFGAVPGTNAPYIQLLVCQKN